MVEKICPETGKICQNQCDLICWRKKILGIRGSNTDTICKGDNLLTPTRLFLALKSKLREFVAKSNKN
jgi:hypothetical protein